MCLLRDWSVNLTAAAPEHSNLFCKITRFQSRPCFRPATRNLLSFFELLKFVLLHWSPEREAVECPKGKAANPDHSRFYGVLLNANNRAGFEKSLLVVNHVGDVYAVRPPGQAGQGSKGKVRFGSFEYGRGIP